LTLEETKQYLIVDYNEHDKYIDELIQSAEDYLIDAIDDYSLKIANDRFKRKARLCALVIAKDLLS
ncbi:head-tail connector protein, partial [Vallitalea sediminicola]